MALKVRLALATLLRVLALRLYPPCTGDAFCRSFIQHTDHSIREICLLCGKKRPWQRVIGPF